MRHIRRAAVTGLFAIWLAPLSAVTEAPAGVAYRTDRPVHAERAATALRRDPEEGPAGMDAAPEA